MENPCEAVKLGKWNNKSWQCCIKGLNFKVSALKNIALNINLGGWAAVPGGVASKLWIWLSLACLRASLPSSSMLLPLSLLLGDRPAHPNSPCLPKLSPEAHVPPPKKTPAEASQPAPVGFGRASSPWHRQQGEPEMPCRLVNSTRGFLLDKISPILGCYCSW